MKMTHIICWKFQSCNNFSFGSRIILSLLVEEIRGPGENHRPVASYSQTLSHYVVHLALIKEIMIGTTSFGISYQHLISLEQLDQLQTTSRFQHLNSCHITGADPGGAPGTRPPPPLKLENIWFFWRKIVKSRTKYPINFRASLRSAQFFLSAPPSPPNSKSWIRPCIIKCVYIFYKNVHI